MANSGVIRMMLAQIAFTAMVTFVKIARQELSTFEVACWRSVIILPFLMLWLRGQSWRVATPKILFWRVTLGFCALSSFFGAAKGITIADLSLISKLQPIFVAILAPIVIGVGEKPDRWLWALMSVAMFGCVLLLAPSLQVGNSYGLLAVSAALFSGGAHTCLRLLKNESPMIVVLWFQIATAAYGALCTWLTLGHIPLPPSHLWPILLGVGVFAIIGQWLMTSAYKFEKAPVVAAASYVGPVFAVFADVWTFSDWPTPISIGGGLLVVGSGLWLLKLSQKQN